MGFYFTLQYRRISRQLEAAGIHPVLGLLLFAVGFLGLSKYLFYKTAFAPWIFTLIALSTLLRLGSPDRNDQLRLVFGKLDYYRVRFLENSLAALPFVGFLLFERQFIFAIGLLPVALLLAMVKNQPALNIRLPTPFWKYPFEFIVGFRNTWWMIALSYFLCAQAIHVGNFNLGLFSLALCFLLGMSFYSKPERTYFVWIFAFDGPGFLRHKAITGLICVSILSAPVLIALYMAFPDKALVTTAVQAIGYCYLFSMVVAKYSAFPKEMNVPQGLLYGLSLWFPPMLLLVVPIFYIQSKRRLTSILG
jgi:hypothetical protein